MLASSSTSETGNARRQHTSPTERDAASDTSHDPRTRSVPTSSAPPSSRDVRATLSPAPTTLTSTRIGARRTAIMYLQREQRDDVARQRSALMTRIVTSPRLHTMRLDRSSSTRASGSHDAAEQLPRPELRLPSARLLVSLFGSFLSVGCPNFWGLVGVHTGPPKFAGMAIQTVRQVQG